MLEGKLKIDECYPFENSVVALLPRARLVEVCIGGWLSSLLGPAFDF